MSEDAFLLNYLFGGFLAFLAVRFGRWSLWIAIPFGTIVPITIWFVSPLWTGGPLFGLWFGAALFIHGVFSAMAALSGAVVAKALEQLA